MTDIRKFAAKVCETARLRQDVSVLIHIEAAAGSVRLVIFLKNWTFHAPVYVESQSRYDALQSSTGSRVEAAWLSASFSLR